MSSHGPGKRPTSKLGAFFWLAAVFSAILSLAISFSVFLKTGQNKEPTCSRRVAEAAYESGELLLLHYPYSEVNEFKDPHDHRRLILARILAVIFTASGVTALALEFFLNGARLLRCGIFGGHSVIAGSGEIANMLVDEFQQRRSDGRSTDPDSTEPVRRLVVIHHSEASDGRAAERRAALVAGEPSDPRVLRHAHITRARHVLFAHDDDSVNVGAALRALALLKDAQAFGTRLYLHVTDPHLRAMLRRHRAFAGGRQSPRTRIFNLYETSARLLLREFPLDYVAIAEDDPRSVLLVLIGLGHMGEAVLVRSAMVAHYGNGLRLAALIIDQEAEAKQKQFRSRYPNFDQVCDVEFLSADAVDIPTHDLIAGRCRDLAQVIPTVVIALDHDSRALSLALALAPRIPSVPIRVRLSDRCGLAELCKHQRLPEHVSLFGSLRQSCSPRVVLEGALDRMASTFHEDYRRRMIATDQAKTTDPNMRPWDELDDDLLDSNRQLADHIEVKLRAAGFHSADPRDKSDDTPRVSDSEFTSRVELLARLEHQRWAAERFLGGWSLGPKDAARRVSPYLVPWEDIHENIRQWDRDIVQTLPSVLAQFGREIRHGRTPPAKASTKTHE